jgi:DNA-binding CsgD family transcriptional regulator
MRENLRSLSPVQLRTALLVAEGLTNSEIAERFTVSEETTKSHLRKCLHRLKAKNRAQLVTRLHQTGYIKWDDEELRQWDYLHSQ